MIRRRAPGKLYLAGEYAVLHPGHPAVLVAIDRFLTATVRESSKATVVFGSDQESGVRVRCDHDGQLAVTGEGSGFDYVLAAAAVVQQLVLEYGGSSHGFELHTGGEDFTADSGRKLGLGSSAAVTVAVIDALASFYGLRLTRTERYRLAMLATLSVNPDGSGGDVAAATWGGWIVYRSPDRSRVITLANEQGVCAALRAPWPEMSVRKLPPPQRVRLLVGWTGQSASTPAMTDQFLNLHGRSRVHAEFCIDSAACVERLASALVVDDVIGAQHAILSAARLLSDFDQDVGVGILTPALSALCAAAEGAGAAAKPSGAGGGDCGIAIVDRDVPAQAAEVVRRWREIGIQPLSLQPLMNLGAPR